MLDATPFANRHERFRFRVTEHGSLTRLQVGMVIEYSGEEYLVQSVTDCRAMIVPLNKRKTVVQIKNKLTDEVREFTPETTGGPIGISPNSECKILRRHHTPTPSL